VPSDPNLDQLSQTELIGLVRNLIQRIEKLELENTALKAENTRLKNENSHLKKELEKLKRQQARSATPFSRNQPKLRKLCWVSKRTTLEQKRLSET
jgi:cell division protein FtsB